jgi:hypothetical protein
MCVACHGAPGKERDEVGRGLMPQPPALAKTAPTWSNGELFWILKHGVKMTGMPAFGPTHSDERLWSMVAFLRRLPNLTPEQYYQLEQTVASTGEHSHESNHGHEHAPEAEHSHKEGHQHGAEPPHANGNSQPHDHAD